MRARALTWFAAFVLCVPTGCVSFYSRKRVTFHVFDFDTRAPVPAARVSVTHDRLTHITHPFSLNPPPDMDAVTDADGRVETRAALSWNPHFAFEADGYYNESWSCSNPGQLRRCSAHGPRCYMVPLLNEVPPKLRVTCPP